MAGMWCSTGPVSGSSRPGGSKEGSGMHQLLSGKIELAKGLERTSGSATTAANADAVAVAANTSVYCCFQC